MKVSIQRHGIVIKTVELTGDRARIGNTPECEVLIDDAYLSAHVADFVRANGIWRIVDAGRLEGVQRDGVRIEDEPAVDGATYSVGGFELVPHLDTPAPARPVQPQMSVRAAASPPTIVERREVPKTIYEAAPAPAANPPVAAAPPLYAPPQPVEAAPAPPRSRRGRILVLSVALFLGFLLVLLALMKPAKKPAATTTASTTTTTVPPAQPQQPATAADEVKAGERALASLNYDAGLQHWEAALKMSPDPALQRRYADVAVEVGRAFLARGESDKGRSYLKKAIDIGPADAESVQVAKRLTR